MGSSLPTPVVTSRTSPTADDGILPLEDMYSSEEDDGPAELNDTSVNSVVEHDGDAADTTPRALKRVKGKEKDVAMASKKKRPLQLLDLPVDILKEIIKEVRIQTAHLVTAG